MSNKVNDAAYACRNANLDQLMQYAPKIFRLDEPEKNAGNEVVKMQRYAASVDEATCEDEMRTRERAGNLRQKCSKVRVDAWVCQAEQNPN
jgi:hypothetical protein